jgi:alpha(1,3/1,4) fucosyltransferase
MLFANYYQQDRVKNASFAEIDRHHTYNPSYTNRLLRSEFLKRGVELNNPDVNAGRPIAFHLLHDGQAIADLPSPKYLIATENPFICPRNRDEGYLKQFNAVFTWNRDLLHLPNAVHLFIPNQIRQEFSPSFEERAIFSCIINANKAFPQSLATDLYRERIEVIRWYEKNAASDFALYGLGWQKPSPAFDAAGKAKRRLQRLATQLFAYKPFPSYAGEVEEKSTVYRNTKFAYCYENVADLPDYISEKIFDAFLSGCVPVYWGSNTINEHIPKECFIDRRQFASTQDVHRYLKSIDATTYARYQKSIADFLTSPAAMQFDTTRYTAIIINRILGDLGR